MSLLLPPPLLHSNHIRSTRTGFLSLYNGFYVTGSSLSLSLCFFSYFIFFQSFLFLFVIYEFQLYTCFFSKPAVHGWVGFDSLSLVEKLDDLRIWDLFVWLLSELGIRVLEFLFGNSIDGLEIGEKGY